MSRNKILSEEAKKIIATQLGIQDQIVNNYWGNVSAKNCGNVVKVAIESVLNKNSSDKNV